MWDETWDFLNENGRVRVRVEEPTSTISDWRIKAWQGGEEFADYLWSRPRVARWTDIRAPALNMN
jgi:hypothetical protein